MTTKFTPPPPPKPKLKRYKVSELVINEIYMCLVAGINVQYIGAGEIKYFDGENYIICHIHDYQLTDIPTLEKIK
jgi:hypothetical protein